MGYWNKSLYRDSLTARTNNMLTDLNLEVSRLSLADTAFSDLEYQSLSSSPSISVVRSIAGKYRTVLDGFMTAIDYDSADCHTLLGYISNEPEDLIFGELYGQYEVAKQNRDRAAEEFEKVNRFFLNLTIPETFDYFYYKNLKESYQDEMDALQKKLDHLGEFDDLCGALFANSVDFRTNAVKAMCDLQDCVSSDGTFKDLGYSSALKNLDKLHEQRQEDYKKQWYDENGKPNMDAIEKFMFQNPESIPMDQKLAFCALMDSLSNEEMTELMNRATRVVDDTDTWTQYLEVSKVLQEIADINCALWCAKYAAAGYERSGFDEEAMKRAIAIKYATVQLEEMKDREQAYIDPNGGVYKHLAVYVDGSKVYILPRVLIVDAEGYAFKVGSDNPYDGVTEIFKKIIVNDTKHFSPYLKNWTVIGVDNESDRDFAIDMSVKNILNQLGGGKSASEVRMDKISDKIKDHIFDKAFEAIAKINPGTAAIPIAKNWIDFYLDLQEEYKKISKNQDAQADLDADIFYSALYIDNATFVTYGGDGYGDAMGFENIQIKYGELQIALAAYKEYGGGTVKLEWIYNYEKCTNEQKEEVAKYIKWFHTAQNGNTTRNADYYRENIIGPKYAEICNKYGFTKPSVVNLSPAQFEEVQKYIKDPSYNIKEELWK